jgi:primosomal protein N' (replication factor Y) (superfamily II helicase)
MSPVHRLAVAVDAPQHSAVGVPLTYASEHALAPGTLVQVPLGRRLVGGVVWDDLDADTPEALSEDRLRPIAGVIDGLPPLDAQWRALVTFCATYYQRGLGEVAMAALPPLLRQPDDTLVRRLLRWSLKGIGRAQLPGAADEPPQLNGEQRQALDLIASATQGTTLLHGVTGSGKTEVYLRAVEQAIASGRQALVLVPEINLTPQLEGRFAARFGARAIASLHSGLTPVQRLQAWWQAQRGEVDIVLGTRLAVFTPLPRLGLIVVDEEHDPSFKQQDGARYSARDLAVWRGARLQVPVVLGSATPSLESWQRAQQGRYRLARMRQRVGDAPMPDVRLIDMGRLPQRQGQPLVLAPVLLEALQTNLAAGEQSLLLLNRRGYAPVLHCAACGWKSDCPHCSAWRVFHKVDRTLRCHHCGVADRVPRGCPDCGNLDLAPIGRGTEKLEEQLGELLPGARIARIDADASRGQGVLVQQLAAVHAGEVDVLVGTQMVTKGHDFRNVTLVAAVNPDGALFTSDFRAPERLFAMLMQAAGRAGRAARPDAEGRRSRMWVQTWHPQHPLYAALMAHDFERFAQTQLEERRVGGLPPFSHLALLRADAVEPEVAMAFLQDAQAAAAVLPEAGPVTLYPVVPLPVQRVAGLERQQMLLESPSRAALQRLLAAWVPALHALRTHHRRLKRWAIDVDPLAV